MFGAVSNVLYAQFLKTEIPMDPRVLRKSKGLDKLAQDFLNPGTTKEEVACPLIVNGMS